MSLARALLERLLVFVRARPRAFFVVCTLVGAGVWWLPFLWEPNGNMAMVPFLVATIAMGLAVGVLAPERPWRWAAALVIGAPITGMILGFVNPNHGVIDSLRATLVAVPIWLFVAVPTAAGAYAGRFLVGSPGVTADWRTPTFAAQRKAFLLAAVCSAILILQMQGTAELIALVAVTAICSAVSTASYGVPAWRSAGSSVAGVLTGFGVVVIVDVARGGPNHHMLPFEMWWLIFVTTPAGVVASWLAYLFGGKGGAANGQHPE